MIPWAWWVISAVTGGAGGVYALISERIATYRVREGAWPWWLVFPAIGVGVIAAAGMAFLVARLVLGSRVLMQVGWLASSAAWVYELVDGAYQRLRGWLDA